MNKAHIAFRSFTESGLIETIKKLLATIALEKEEYLKEIGKHKKNRPQNQAYYDYERDLDFSIDLHNPADIKKKLYDDRFYYYKVYQYFKLGLFERKDIPLFKVKLLHLSDEIIYELSQLDISERNYVLKQAVGRIFEDVNFDIYHNSISSKLEVILVK